MRATSLRLNGKSSTRSTVRRCASRRVTSGAKSSPTSGPVERASCSRMRQVMPHLAAPIVLVEDDTNDVYFVRYAFEHAHIVNPLLRFATAREARVYFTDATIGATPTLFVIDVHLAGGETGLDFLRWLRQQ